MIASTAACVCLAVARWAQLYQDLGWLVGTGWALCLVRVAGLVPHLLGILSATS